MPKLVPTVSVGVTRDGKRVTPPVGKPFMFTADEVKEIKGMMPSALRAPVNESAPEETGHKSDDSEAGTKKTAASSPDGAQATVTTAAKSPKASAKKKAQERGETGQSDNGADSDADADEDEDI